MIGGPRYRRSAEVLSISAGPAGICGAIMISGVHGGIGPIVCAPKRDVRWETASPPTLIARKRCGINDHTAATWSQCFLLALFSSGDCYRTPHSDGKKGAKTGTCSGTKGRGYIYQADYITGPYAWSLQSVVWFLARRGSCSARVRQAAHT